MSTESQIHANQVNARLSTGPRTDEGKAVSRYNARRHGLTGQFYVMDDADRLAYNDFEHGMFEALQPLGNYERQLAVSISQDHWRLNRVKGIEHNTLGLGHEEHSDDDSSETLAQTQVETAVSNAKTWRADNRRFSNIALYETRLHRMIAKNKKDLDDLQAKRQAEEAKAREEAELFLSLQLMNAEKIDQSKPVRINGFVFSTPQILADLAWKQTLAEARWYKANNWDRTKRPPFALLNFPKAA